MVLYPNKLPESERVCSGICKGIWFSDFWMKVLVIFLFVYTAALGLIVYCVT